MGLVSKEKKRDYLKAYRVEYCKRKSFLKKINP